MAVPAVAREASRGICSTNHQKAGNAAAGRFLGLSESLTSFRLTVVRKEQFGFLRQRHHAEQLPTGLLTMLEQGIRSALGRIGWPLYDIEQRLLQPRAAAVADGIPGAAGRSLL